MGYVNYLGNEVWPGAPVKQKRAKADVAAFHKGWKVVGVTEEMVQAAAEKAKRDEKQFDRENYIANSKGKAVRAKPYEIKEAAELCADMARKGGWLAVRIEEMKKEVAELFNRDVSADQLRYPRPFRSTK